jgi:hypothetical protein
MHQDGETQLARADDHTASGMVMGNAMAAAGR